MGEVTVAEMVGATEAEMAVAVATNNAARLNLRSSPNVDTLTNVKPEF